MRGIGALNRENMQRLFPALGLYPFTQRLHMTQQEFEELTERAQQEADNPSLKPYFPLYVVHRRHSLPYSNTSGMFVLVESVECTSATWKGLRISGFGVSRERQVSFREAID